MIKQLSAKVTTLTVLASGLVMSTPASAQALPAEVSAYEQYSDLIQVLHCPEDRDGYGDYNDYGYWGGGAWCGQTGEAGYWVYSDYSWYVWLREGGDNQDLAAPLYRSASADYQYSNLLQVLNCPSDYDVYGDYDNYGYWGGGAWCGQAGEEGYWVWEYPNWYVWGTQN